MIKLRRLSTADRSFERKFKSLVAFDTALDTRVDKAVAKILAELRSRGDEALLEYTRRLDKLKVKTARELELPQQRLKQALQALPHAQCDALQQAAERIRKYHEKQIAQSWSYRDADGSLLGQQVTPLERVGMYVPGGKAAYPSTVLMNAIPAKLAGVPELIMAVPTPNGEQNDLVLASAAICG
ncbi:MAG TPA: histidinol dehydrogenase, partial [Burkholderiales bacterium]|nr:histidinol dehydrogenase [Burkholderiales bacterium]